MTSDMDALAGKLRGRFIVVDGPDGAGKSTQIKLLTEALQAVGTPVTLCRDPGGTAIGDRIRAVLLDHDLAAMDETCETLLFMASRAQLLTEVIRPALARRDIVLCDRFVSSTCAYQGAAGFIPRRVVELAELTLGDCWPDLTIIVDVDVDTGFTRIGQGHRTPSAGGGSAGVRDASDAMEARPLAFHRRVREYFHKLNEYYPGPVVMIDGSANATTVHVRILECLDRVSF